MNLKLYADVHVLRAISVALHVRDVDVLTAQADGAAELEDPELLDRATVSYHTHVRPMGTRREKAAVSSPVADSW